jgi:hypothetical protein
MLTPPKMTVGRMISNVAAEARVSGLIVTLSFTNKKTSKHYQSSGGV